MTLQHWKIYRKIAGGREVQTNSAEKLIERDRGLCIGPRSKHGRLSRARIFYFGRHSVCFDLEWLHVRVVRKYFPSLIR